MKSGIQQAVEKYDNSASRLAEAAGGGLFRQQIEHSLKSGKVPERWAHLIERASGVPVEKLAPGVRWLRIRDADWPHPDGRPVVDFASNQQPVDQEAAHG